MKKKISKKTLLSISSVVSPTSVIVPLTISCSSDDNSVANSSVQLPNDLVDFLEKNTLQVTSNQSISAKAFFAEAITDSTDLLNSVSNVSISRINGVNQRIIRGNYDNDGVCVTTTYTSFTINSNKYDSKGNSAEGKYNPLNTKKLRLYYYFKNGY